MKQPIMMKRARTRSPSAPGSKQPHTMKSNSSDGSQAENMRGNLRVNIQNSVDKYTTLAREAMMTGDRVLAESYYQQAEHYLRLSNEYKENILVMPRNEEAAVAKKVAAPSSDFETSMEQELAAQAGL